MTPRVTHVARVPLSATHTRAVITSHFGAKKSANGAAQETSPARSSSRCSAGIEGCLGHGAGWALCEESS